MADITKKVGERIRLLRITKGFSREKLSELSDINANYIGQVERGEKNLTIETLQKLIRGMSVTLEELFRHLDPMEKKDVLGEIMEDLSARSPEDQAVVLQLLRTMFDWEEKKHGKS
ncbi:helix-turn-helix domain-containing protein [Cohnella silvisoli]|uniref:Helix-turn-helix transcriptional regulator n=1 Tax=Cohnella silvisoli TaxID=2873699 RepID=A0ABV1KZA4_9BACL|nr:helix-turn-helix transcriptional regulator [Cohnella silvisoli]MCD9024707.1 helix-turn-helix domain-containing protein [Cohnella silvisoli]